MPAQPTTTTVNVPAPTTTGWRRSPWQLAAVLTAVGAALAAVVAVNFYGARRRRVRQQQQQQQLEHGRGETDGAAAVDQNVITEGAAEPLSTFSFVDAGGGGPDLASSVPFLSSSIRLAHLEGRGVGFVCVRPISAGELLLVDCVLTVPTDDDLVYDWHAHAQLVQQLHVMHPEALDSLYVDHEAQAGVDADHPIPLDLRSSPIAGVDDRRWLEYLHAMANNAYIRDEDDEEHTSLDESSSPGYEDSDDPSSSSRRPLSTTPPCSMNLLLLTCKFNHSCHPQACSSNGRVYACAPISVGEEVCVSYLLPEQGLFLPRAPRRSMLQAFRHFDCTCPRCEGVDPSMRELEAAITRTSLDPAAIHILDERIEGELEAPSTDCPAWLELVTALDASYGEDLPASHWLRFTIRRRLLLEPPPFWSASQFHRGVLEHWCMMMMLLPSAHMYKVLEVEEIAQAIERAQPPRMLLSDFRLALLRMDEAFAPDAPLASMDNDATREIMARRFGIPAAHEARCTSLDCPHRLDEDSEPDSASAVAAATAPQLLSTFVCASCAVPLVACLPECHAWLVRWHAPVCSLLALTRTDG